jgi:hypothetical protein
LVKDLLKLEMTAIRSGAGAWRGWDAMCTYVASIQSQVTTGLPLAQLKALQLVKLEANASTV